MVLYISSTNSAVHFLSIKMDRFIYNKNQMSINQSITKTTYMYRLILGTTFDLLHYTYIVSIIFVCFLFFFCYKRDIRGRVLCVCVCVAGGWGWGWLLLMIGRKIQILIFSLSYLRMC